MGIIGECLKWLHVKVDLDSTYLREVLSSGESFVNYTPFRAMITGNLLLQRYCCLFINSHMYQPLWTKDNLFY